MCIICYKKRSNTKEFVKKVLLILILKVFLVSVLRIKRVKAFPFLANILTC